jgi:hypothetical protein
MGKGRESYVTEPREVEWAGGHLGGVLGIVLTPILTYLWATYSVYGYFGRTYFVVALGCMAGLAGLYALRRANVGPQGSEKSNTEQLVFGMTFVGLAVSLVGCVLDYWGGTPGEDLTWVQTQGFGIGVGFRVVVRADGEVEMTVAL